MVLRVDARINNGAYVEVGVFDADEPNAPPYYPLNAMGVTNIIPIGADIIELRVTRIH